VAERWQQWMPFHIDRFRGSLHVQGMPGCARAGYLYLLASAWQSEDCSLPEDDFELQILSGLTQKEWIQFKVVILRRFAKHEGRLVNEVLRAEWHEAKLVFEKRQNAAKNTNASRTAHGDRTVTARRPLRSADTGTGTGTTTETEKTKTLASTASAVPASRPVFTFPLVGKNTHIVTEGDIHSWSRAYPAVDVRAELRRVLVWLEPRPEKRSATVKGSQKRIIAWLAREQDRGGRNGFTSENRSGSKGVNRVSEALDELRKAGVGLSPGAAEDRAGEVRPVAGRGDGRGAPGIVLEGSC
jgi:uncharacterized protein YdaU (DUF1376 family)